MVACFFRAAGEAPVECCRLVNVNRPTNINSQADGHVEDQVLTGRDSITSSTCSAQDDL